MAKPKSDAPGWSRSESRRICEGEDAVIRIGEDQNVANRRNASSVRISTIAAFMQRMSRPRRALRGTARRRRGSAMVHTAYAPYANAAVISARIGNRTLKGPLNV